MAVKRKASKPSERRNTGGISDAVVLLIFLVVIVSIVFLYDDGMGAETMPDKEYKKLLSELVIDGGSSGGHALVVGNVVDTTMLNEISQTRYDQLKETLGVDVDFIIYFEDQEGNLLQLVDKPCIGSGNAFVNGYRCSK